LTESYLGKFDHVHIVCSDLGATERWFVDTLGAEFMRRRDSGGTPSSIVRLGGAQVYLRAARKGEILEPAGTRRYGTDHFSFLVSDLGTTAAELRRRGVFFEVEPFEFMPGLFMSYVVGPDNVRIEFVERRGEAS
jgi:catechol 2,3-dioxygenase-like lactoylglutathione lyase family enzyme